MLYILESATYIEVPIGTALKTHILLPTYQQLGINQHGTYNTKAEE